MTWRRIILWLRVKIANLVREPLARIGVAVAPVLAPLSVVTALTALVGSMAAAGFINSLEAALLDHVMNDGAYTPPTNWFVATSTTTPTETGSNFTEPSGNGYARVSTAAADWAAAVAGDPSTKANGNAITFPTSTGAQGTQTHFGLFTASSAGTVQIWGALTTSKAVSNGDTASFAASALVLKLGDPADTY